MGGNRRSYGRTAALLVSFYVAVLLFGPQQAEKGEGFFKDLYCTVGFFSGASCDLDYSQISMVMEEDVLPEPSVMSEQITVAEEPAPVTNVYNTHPVTVVYKPEPVYEFAGNTDFYTPPPAPVSTVEEWTPLALFHKQVDKIYDRLGDRIDDLEDDLGDAFTTLSLTLTGALYDNNDSAGLNGNVLVSTGSGVVWTATSSLGITGGGGSSQWTTAGSDIYYTGGSVGIGTSTPQYRLTVTEDGVVPEVSAVINGSGSTISVQGDGSAYFMARDVTNDIEGIFGTSINGSIFFGSMTDHALQLRTGNTTRLIIASTTGDVGVAISPTAKLHILNTSSRPSFQVEDAASPDSTPFVIDASGDIGIGTAVPTHALTLTSGKVEAFYNTVDQVTNYERVTMGYLSNIFTIRAQEAGTGTARALRLTSNIGSFTVGTASTNGVFQFGHTSATTNGIGILSNGTETHSSGVYTVQSLANTINQSGTAGYTMLLINPTETTIGSGLRKLIDARVGGTTRFVVQSDGNVGIGTSTPSKLLHISSATADALLIERTSANNSNIQYKNTLYSMFAGMNSNGAFAVGTNSDLTNPSLTKLIVTQAGRVGIGTTTPRGLLEVSAPTGANYAYVTSFDDSTVGIRLSRGPSGNDWAIENGAGVLRFRSSTNEFASESARAALSTNGLVVGNTSTVNFRIEGLASSGSGYFGLTNSTPGDIFIVNGSGNVGIGTTTPSQELTVSGDLRLTGAIYDSNNSAGTSGYVLQSTATGQRWVATSTLGFGTGSLSASDIDTSSELLAIVTDETGAGNLVFSASPTFTGTVNAAAATLSSMLTMSGSSANIALGSNYLSGDGDDEGVFVSSLGNVGIGTSSPASDLHIDGSFEIRSTANTKMFVADGSNALRLAAWTNTNTSRTQMGFQRYRGTMGAPLAVSQNDYLGSLAFQGYDGSALQQGGGIDGYVDGTVSSGTVPLRISFVTGTNQFDRLERLTIKADGNIGIGTTTPSAKLDVWGDFKVGTSSTPTLFAQTSTGFVGIGNASPIAALNVMGATILGRATGDTGGAGSLSVGLNTWAYGDASLSVGNGSIANTNNSIALGITAGTYGDGAVAIGHAPQANGDFSIALGSAMTGSGYGGNGEGLHAMAIGLGDMTGVRPMVTGTSSLGIFLGDQSGLEVSAEQVMVIMGGNVGIGTTSPSAKLSIHAANGETNSKLFVIASSTAGATTDLFSVLNNGETYINSSFLSLNNTSGAAYLDVTGSGDANSYSNLTLGSTAGPYWFMSHRTGGAFGLYYTSDDVTYHNPLMVEPATPTGTLYLDSTGNVGIGTTTPSSKLYVYGTFKVGTSSATTTFFANTANNRVGINTVTPEEMLDVHNGNIKITDTQNQARKLTLQRNGTSIGQLSTENSQFTLKSLSNTDLMISEDSGVGILLRDGGNVGIGDTSPDDLLNIHSAAAAAQIAITSLGTDTDPTLGFQLVDGTNTFTLGIDDSDSDKFKISGSALGTNDRLVIDSTGNVGIGTSSPASKLTISGGDVLIDNGEYYQAKRNTSGTAINVLGFESGTDNLFLRTGGASVSNKFSIVNTGSTEMFTVLNSGLVGIGTTTPNQKLSIFANAADAAVSFGTASGANEKWTIGIDDSDGAKFKISSSSALGTNDRLVINGAGYVGIGTSAPERMLHVYGVGNSKAIFESSDGNQSGFLLKNTQDSVGIGIGSDEKFHIGASTDLPADSWLTVDQTGNVGIGTTTPGAKLDVNGVFRVIGNGNPTSGAGIEMTYSANVGYIFPYDRTAAAGRDLILGGSGAGLMVQSDGDVGIGTSTPVARTSIVNSSGITLQLDKSTGAALQFSRAGVYGYQIDDSAGIMRWLSSGTTERMRLDSTGSLGINTTAFGASNNNGAAFIPYAGGIVQEIGHNGTAADGDLYVNFRRSGVSLGSIAQVSSTGVVYNTTSDRRVKEDIDYTKLGLADLMNLPVRDFSFKIDESGEVTTGFIAQELYEIFPYAVTTNGDNGVTPLQADKSPWSVDYGRVTPLIVKSVQDLNLDLQALLAGSQSPTSTFAFLLEEEDTVWSRLVVLAENFVDGVLTLAGITTDELCLKDEQGSTCIDREELEALIAGANNGSSSSDTEDEEEEVVPELSEDVEDETSSSTPEVPADDIQIEDSGEEEAQEDIEDESEDPQELVEIEEADDDTLETNE